MVSRGRYKNLTWIDLESPAPEEVRMLMHEFEIHPLVAEELLKPSFKQKVDRYPGFLYVILHFPSFREGHTVVREDQEIDFIIGKDFLITAHYDLVSPLRKLLKVFETSSMTERGDYGNHGGHLFFLIAKSLYRAVDYELEYVSESLREIEKNIFEGKEREMVAEISKASRSLLSFKHSLRLHEGALESLEQAGRSFFGDHFGYYLKSLMSEYHRAHQTVEAHLATLSELRETNNSLVSTKQNEAIKVLTMMAFIMFALTLIAAVFSMETALPFVERENGFWIIIGIMAMTTALSFGFFRYRKWL